MTQTVYLAGPISGLSYSGSVDWREYCARVLESDRQIRNPIKTLSPLRCFEHLSHVEQFSDSGDEPERTQSPLSIPRGLTTRDRFDATRCDVLLVNLLGAQKVSIGTVMEIGWADLKRTPIVVAIEPAGNVHEHAMVMEAIGFRCSTLDEALHVVKAILV